ncbi:MAG: tRNA (N6-isopentenyl adenosine(37)-C2)-methylthiotransferase MiaB, partial [Deltaproteobacteria bacterium]|nr:tRNA (N6-isopentenyl adenosine(37)-C2)-methylthiotransferase MiaB [Deltaproteobacteria bacterium]
MTKHYYIRTFGCQMNEHDSQKIAGQLTHLGFSPIADILKADLVLFNTCTIREKAHQKAFSDIGRAVKQKTVEQRKTRIAICGCVAQEEGAKLLSRFPEIDLIFGPDQIYRL